MKEIQYSNKRRGVALVIVLSMLVLLAGIIIAYFSRAVEQRKVSSNSAASASVDLFAQGALEYVFTDLRSEIVAGSTEIEEADVKIFEPLREESGGLAFYPTIRPQSNISLSADTVPADPFKSLIKLSRGGVPFFQSNYHTGTGVVRASGISTETPSINGRFLSREDWNLPKLMQADELAAFSSPDWVYVTRDGDNPVDSTNIETNKLRDMANEDFVLGRFAYTIYDVGGLLDITAAGNKLPLETNAERGLLNQVPLEELRVNGDSVIEDPAKLVDLRWPATGGNSSDVSESGGMFDPQRNFIDVHSGDQTFVNRGDLLAFVKKFPDVLSEDALPFLTTFSRELNAPSWAPDPDRSLERDQQHNPSSSPVAAHPQFNLLPDPLATTLNLVPYGTDGRRTSGGTITLPEGGTVEVKAGDPVLFRRFPLSKIRLLQDNAASNNVSTEDSAAILYYFGLTRDAKHRWTYRGGQLRILNLSEVAALDPPREADFFELLQAVIYTGSLAKTAGYSMSDDFPIDGDGRQNVQIMQIGANIIDQWDDNDYPTVLELGGQQVAGIENLPYINQSGLSVVRPIDDAGSDPTRRQMVKTYMAFDLWNPHQNASVTANGIRRLWIAPIQGTAYVTMRLLISGDWRPTPIYNNNAFSARIPESGQYNVTSSPPLEIPYTHNFAEPETVGDQTDDDEDRPRGVIVVQGEIPGGFAIPPAAERSTSLWSTINSLYFNNTGGGSPSVQDYVSPGNRSVRYRPVFVGQGGAPSDYSPPLAEGHDNPPYDEYSVDSTGARVYTYAITGIEHDPGPANAAPFSDWRSYWDVDTAAKRVRANVGGKVHNIFYLSSGQTAPTLVGFELRAETTDGDIIPYQRFDNIARFSNNSWSGHEYFFDHNSAGNPDLTASDKSRGRFYIYDESFIVGDPPPAGRFFRWRDHSLSSAMMTHAKADPRTRRFGLANFTVASADRMGHSIRPQMNELIANGVGSHYSGSVGGSVANYRWAGAYPANVPGVGWSTTLPGYGGLDMLSELYGFKFFGQYRDSSGGGPRWLWIPAATATNPPDTGVNAWNPMQYPDPDGVIRPGDAYLGDVGPDGVFPMAPGRLMDRPLILNRPFRSVGELGYVFRDVPWKSLDLFTQYSADAGLLDIFSVQDTPENPPVLGGKVNLNTRHPEVLAAILAEVASQVEVGSMVQSRMDASLAETLAEEIVEQTRQFPLGNKGDLPRNIMDDALGIAGLTGKTKRERETILRPLAEIGMTRTWNLMIDFVAQKGRVVPGADGLEDFNVEGQKRYWVHLAIDRYTGEIVDSQIESVYE